MQRADTTLDTPVQASKATATPASTRINGGRDLIEEQQRRNAPSEIIKDPTRDLQLTLQTLKAPQEIKDLALSNFSKLTQAQKKDFLEVLSVASSHGSDNEISKEGVKLACIKLLARTTEDGNPALLNIDRLNQGTLLSHLKQFALDNSSPTANQSLVKNRDRLLAHLIHELSDNIGANITQGKTTWCVCDADMKDEFSKAPSEVARALKEAVLEGKITTLLKNEDGSPLTIQARSEALNDGVRQGAALASSVLIVSRLAYIGFTDSGLLRFQDEKFAELNGTPARLDAVDPELCRTLADNKSGIRHNIERANQIISERLADVDSNGKMKNFSVSMVWAATGQEHSYHKLLFSSYDAKTDTFLAFNPWPPGYKLPPDLAAYGIHQAEGELGKAGGVIVPRDALAKLMNYAVYKTDKIADLGISHDAIASVSEQGEATEIVGLNLSALASLLPKPKEEEANTTQNQTKTSNSLAATVLGFTVLEPLDSSKQVNEPAAKNTATFSTTVLRRMWNRQRRPDSGNSLLNQVLDRDDI